MSDAATGIAGLLGGAIPGIGAWGATGGNMDWLFGGTSNKNPYTDQILALLKGQQGNAVEFRMGHAVDERRRARTQRGETCPGGARDFRLRARHKCAGRFGMRQRERQSCVAGGLNKVRDCAAARHAEQSPHARIPQSRDQRGGFVGHSPILR